MMQETLAGKIVVPMGLYGHADFPEGAKAATNDGDESTEVKQMLDSLHFRKIKLADEVIIVTQGKYIGSSTRREIAHAESLGKVVRYIDFAPPAPAPAQAEGATPTPRVSSIPSFILYARQAYRFENPIQYCLTEDVRKAFAQAQAEAAALREQVAGVTAKQDFAHLAVLPVEQQLRMWSDRLETDKGILETVAKTLAALRSQLECAERERDAKTRLHNAADAGCQESQEREIKLSSSLAALQAKADAQQREVDGLREQLVGARDQLGREVNDRRRCDIEQQDQIQRLGTERDAAQAALDVARGLAPNWRERAKKAQIAYAYLANAYADGLLAAADELTAILAEDGGKADA
jgi:ATP-dependent Lon protease